MYNLIFYTFEICIAFLSPIDKKIIIKIISIYFDHSVYVYVARGMKQYMKRWIRFDVLHASICVWKIYINFGDSVMCRVFRIKIIKIYIYLS